MEEKEIRKHIRILAVYGGDPDTGDPVPRDGTMFLYSYGMEKFERPDLMVTDVPEWLVPSATEFLNGWCAYSVEHEIKPHENIADEGQHFVLHASPAQTNFRENRYGLLKFVSLPARECEGEGHGKEPVT